MCRGAGNCQWSNRNNGARLGLLGLPVCEGPGNCQCPTGTVEPGSLRHSPSLSFISIGNWAAVSNQCGTQQVPEPHEEHPGTIAVGLALSAKMTEPHLPQLSTEARVGMCQMHSLVVVTSVVPRAALVFTDHFLPTLQVWTLRSGRRVIRSGCSASQLEGKQAV